MQLLATAMDTNDTRSIISTLPQQQIIYLPVDQDATGTAAGPLAGQQQANASAVSALLMHKLGAADLGSVSSASEGTTAVLPLQAALPYGGGTASKQSAEQSSSATGIASLPAVSGNTDPVLILEAQNMIGADLHQSKGALEQHQETGDVQPG